MEFIKNEIDSEFRVKIAREIFHPDKVNNKKNDNQYSESKAVVENVRELLTANDNSKSIKNSRKFTKFDNCIFCDKLHASECSNEVSNMKQVAAVAEWHRYRIVACLVTSSSPVPLKTRRGGQRCTLNLSRAETSSRWCGVVVRTGGASSGVVHVT
ncbi:integrase catalytic domain-containing protein [Trichonephila clavipes]|nr:integrase catalytic domain-containing protein [Trichonephila clavipes]